MITKYIYGGFALVILVLGVTAGFYKWKSDKQAVDVLSAQNERDNAKAELEAEKARAKALQDDISALREAARVRSELLEQLRQQKEKSDERLEKALSEHDDWSDTRIPDSVRDSLKD